MDTPTAPEIADKIRQIRGLTDAIARAMHSLAANPSVATALEIQHLQQRRIELRGTLPALHVVQ